MKDVISQNCPLCSSCAVFYFVDFDERKYFKCPTCLKFLITRRAENDIKNASNEWRDNLSGISRNAPQGSTIDISVKLNTTENYSETISYEYIQKDTLRL